MNILALIDIRYLRTAPVTIIKKAAIMTAHFSFIQLVYVFS